MVDGAAHAEAGTVTDVGVNHGSGDVFVAEELLDGANIVAVLEQMGSKTVPESVATGGFVDAGGADGVADGVLEVALGGVVAAFFAGARVEGDAIGGEDVLPNPMTRGVWIFTVERVGEVKTM